MPIKNNQLDFSGQNIYVGIDTHLKHFTVSIRGEDLLYQTFSQPPQSKILVNYLHKHYPGATYYAAYEAGFSGFWLCEELLDQGVKCIVVNAGDVPTTDKEKKQKRDAIDSKKIAKALSNGELEAIHVPEKSTQQDRSLLRVRQRLIGNQTRCRNRIKSLLRFYGIEFPEQFKHAGSHWSKRFMNWLADYQLLDGSGQDALTLLYTEASYLRELLLKTNSSILQLSKTPTYKNDVELLLSIPGVGRLTAMVLLTELGNIERFNSLDKLCGFVGLVPNVYASGDKEYIGDMTKRGNRRLKTYLIESSWIAVRKDPALSLKYHQLCKRMNGNKAIIRIARKLVNRVRHVLLQKQEYQIGITA